jgi:hypothetical protein
LLLFFRKEDSSLLKKYRQNADILYLGSVLSGRRSTRIFFGGSKGAAARSGSPVGARMSERADIILERLLGATHLAPLRKRLRQSFARTPLGEEVEHIRVGGLSVEEHAKLASLARPGGSAVSAGKGRYPFAAGRKCAGRFSCAG